MGLGLLWCVYILLDFLDTGNAVPEATRGVVGLFIVVEFTLVMSGTIVGRPPAAEIAHEVVGRVVALLEQNNHQVTRLVEFVATAPAPPRQSRAGRAKKTSEEPEAAPLPDDKYMRDIAEAFRLGQATPKPKRPPEEPPGTPV